ncbi:MAG: hypothetical protein Q8J64_03095 [Thermodesulfovibrionales bacterium]|nr:hypothetical protein [Thermodesulfovibrionales bacterium]
MAGFIPYFLIGFVSLIMQVTAVRELLTQFSGNELVIGITLSLWLMLVGAGSFIGGLRTPEKGGGPHAPLAVSFLVIAFLSVPTIVFIMSIRSILSLAPGETISFQATFLFTLISLLPLCLTLGLQFPLAVSLMGKQKGRENPAGSVYAIEAAGAFAAGLAFTFLISGRMDSLTLGLFAGIAAALASSYLLGRKSAVALVLIPIAFYAAQARFYIGDYQKVVKKAQSRYGEIWVTRLNGQSNIYSSGRLLFSYPDPQTEELGAHLVMPLHPEAEDALIVGGSAGMLREFLKYPVKRVDFIEIDPELIKVSLGLLNRQDRQAVTDKRIRIIPEDARRFISSLGAPSYDLIVLNTGEPSNANINRLYTVDFFNEAAAALKHGGMITLSLPVSHGYVGRRMKMSNGAVYNSMKAVFKHVEATTEEYGRLFASMSPVETAPDALMKRFDGMSISAEYFHGHIFEDAFSPLRAGQYKARLGSSGEINTDMRPSAYLYNLMLWAEAHGGRFLEPALSLSRKGIMLIFAGGLALAGLAVFRRKKRTLYYSAFGTGYAAMAASMAIILSFQAKEGYVYEAIGLITASFMAGIALGAPLPSRLKMKNPLAGLIFFEVISALFCFSLPFLFASETLYYILSAGAGALTGCVFGTLTLSMEIEPREAGGRLYAVDLIGSFSGSLLAAIIFIPLIGIRGAVMTAALVKTVSAVLAAFIYEKD